MVYHIQRVLRFWITPLQLPSVHWNNRHSGVSERRWAKFCVERLGLLTSKLTSSSTRVHNGTPHSSRVMRYCSSGTPMSHLSWSITISQASSSSAQAQWFSFPAPASLSCFWRLIALANLPPGAHPHITSLLRSRPKSNCRSREQLLSPSSSAFYQPAVRLI